MAQRRADNLRYNCDEKFVLRHRCKKLFIIEVVGDSDEDEIEEEIECSALSGGQTASGISLHAVSGWGRRRRGPARLQFIAQLH
jgi:hypothetical protein